MKRIIAILLAAVLALSLAAVLAEGDAADRDDIVYLEKLPLIFK